MTDFFVECTTFPSLSTQECRTTSSSEVTGCSITPTTTTTTTRAPCSPQTIDPGFGFPFGDDGPDFDSFTLPPSTYTVTLPDDSIVTVLYGSGMSDVSIISASTTSTTSTETTSSKTTSSKPGTAAPSVIVPDPTCQSLHSTARKHEY